MSDEFISLNDLQLDALKEIGNVGAGNAATALSQIISRRIKMTVPKVTVLPLNEVPDAVGGADIIVAGVYLRVLGAAPGSILFLLPRDSAFALIEMLIGQKRVTTGDLTELEQSAVVEIGNILANAYLNALSQFTKLTLLPTLPSLAIDMAGALLSIILIQLGQVGNHALFIETEFNADGDEVKGHFFLIPDPGALNTVLNAIGVRRFNG